MKGANAIRVRDLSGGYGSGIVVRGISLAATAGQAVCILGLNGVGKSTLLKLIMGYLRPISGAIEIGDVALRGLSPLDRVRASVSYCPQERVVFDDLTVAENLTLMSSGQPLAQFEPYFAAFPRLKERLTQHAGTLSGGEKKLLSLVRALSERRSVIVLDEPTEGVQFENVHKMAQLINERKAEGAAFVVAEQNLNFVDEIANDIIVMNHGEVVLAGRRDELDRREILGHLRV